MDKSAHALWDGKREAPKGLRLPKTPAPVFNSKEETSNKPETKPETQPVTSPNDQNNDISIKSRLSVDAPEFYPSSYRVQYAPANESSSVQDRLKKHKLGAQNSSSEGPSDNLSEVNNFEGSQDDLRLQHIIVTLTKDAGQYDDLLDIFMETLVPHFNNIFALSHTAHRLVTHAIYNPSFRYTAAKLCCHIESCCPTFRAELHLTCEKKIGEQINKAGLLLFVAELYTQLHHENIYGNYLINAYKQLLAVGGNDYVKAICQALKLTGYSLELYDKTALDEVFEKLKEIQKVLPKTGSAVSLVKSVINLRSTNWGRSSPVEFSSTLESADMGWGDASYPVFYSTDGSKFTTEESEFLAAHVNTSDEYYVANLSDPDELCDPEPEMDEEIQEAFKDFVKLTKKDRRN